MRGWAQLEGRQDSWELPQGHRDQGREVLRRALAVVAQSEQASPSANRAAGCGWRVCPPGPAWRPDAPCLARQGPPPCCAAPQENAKTKICLRWLAGNCTYAERCNFAHGEEELRTLPPRSPNGRGRGRGRGGYDMGYSPGPQGYGGGRGPVSAGPSWAGLYCRRFCGSSCLSDALVASGASPVPPSSGSRQLVQRGCCCC